MTEDEWRARLADLVERARQRREHRDAERAEMAERRRYGLERRHATKLARLAEKATQPEQEAA